jgi:hypothetical protein
MGRSQIRRVEVSARSGYLLSLWLREVRTERGRDRHDPTVVPDVRKRRRLGSVRHSTASIHRNNHAVAFPQSIQSCMEHHDFGREARDDKRWPTQRREMLTSGRINKGDSPSRAKIGFSPRRMA